MSSTNGETKANATGDILIQRKTTTSADVLQREVKTSTHEILLNDLENILKNIETRSNGQKRWKCLKYLGGTQGTSAIVLAKDMQYGLVALKFVPTPPTSKSYGRFVRELKFLARIGQHQNVAVHKSDKPMRSVDRSLAVGILEFVPGKNVNDMIKDMKTMPQHLTVQIGIDVARGLVHVHKKGLAHKDIKCANIMCGPEGFKIVDFGIAAIEDEDVKNELGRDSTLVTKTKQNHSMSGTMHYMSPEQYGYKYEESSSSEDSSGEQEETKEQTTSVPGVDKRTDIWSLGVVMYHCVTGKLPFGRNKHGFGQISNAVINSKGCPKKHINIKKAHQM